MLNRILTDTWHAFYHNLIELPSRFLVGSMFTFSNSQQKHVVWPSSPVQLWTSLHLAFVSSLLTLFPVTFSVNQWSTTKPTRMLKIPCGVFQCVSEFHVAVLSVSCTEVHIEEKGIEYFNICLLQIAMLLTRYKCPECHVRMEEQTGVMFITIYYYKCKKYIHIPTLDVLNTRRKFLVLIQLIYAL